MRFAVRYRRGNNAGGAAYEAEGAQKAPCGAVGFWHQAQPDPGAGAKGLPGHGGPAGSTAVEILADEPEGIVLLKGRAIRRRSQR